MSAGISATTFAPFVPTSIPGCVLSLRADRGITLATGVSVWADQSGNGNNVSQATGSAQPTYNSSGGPNGQPYLNFAQASNQFLASAAFSLSQPLFVWIVANQSGGSGNQYSIDGRSANTLALLIVSQTIVDMNAGAVLSWTSASAGTFQSYGMQFNGASSSLYSNNVSKASGSAGTNAVGGITIGAFGNGGGGFLNGNIAEVIVYNSILSSDSLNTLESYGNARYRF